MSELPYEFIIGLEVHVQLDTKSKLFCGCPTMFGQPPNTLVCPTCLGQPGALPVMNQEAVRLSIRTGLALNCDIATTTKWDRKSYFYPDLPKGYQISQFDQPICGEGYVDFPDPDQPGELQRVRLIRAHLEEDAGKSMHDESGSGKAADSKIDLNRTGTPLLEIVSYPDVKSPTSAKAYLQELRLILTYLGVSDCNMQEGSLRADANINLKVQHEGSDIFTPIVEVKNLNSFRAVERAMVYEGERQFSEWKKTGKQRDDSPKQTRGWDDDKGVTYGMREKEESSDYRYFPDPDLVPLKISDEQISAEQSTLGELPGTIRARLQSDHGLKAYDADVIVSQGMQLVEYFSETVAAGATAKRVSSWLQQDVLRSLNESDTPLEQFPIQPPKLASLIKAIDSGDLDNTRAKDVFAFWLTNQDSDLQAAMASLGIENVDDSELETLCKELLEENAHVVEQVKAGKNKALGSLIPAAKKKNPNVDPRKVMQICEQLIQQM